MPLVGRSDYFNIINCNRKSNTFEIICRLMHMGTEDIRRRTSILGYLLTMVINMYNVSGYKLWSFNRYRSRTQ